MEHLTGFLDRFRRLNVRSNEQLDALVEQARRVVQGVGPQELRDSAGLRQRVADGLSAVQNSLDPLLVDQPRRRILRARHPGAITLVSQEVPP